MQNAANGARRVVVTGIGLVTGIGNTREENWTSMMEGQSGAGPITHFDASGFQVRFAVEVKNFDLSKYFDHREQRRTAPYIHYAVAASEEALADSGLQVTPDNADRIGVYISSGIGGFGIIEREHARLMKEGPRHISPYFMISYLVNMADGYVSIRHGLKGPSSATATACAAGVHAIGESFRLIQDGDADVMVCGGTEGAITPMGVGGFSAAKAMSTNNDNPKGASRPFDLNRDGFVLGEGAGIMVIEEYEHARARGAKIYAEVVGYGMSADAHHITTPAPNGDGVYRMIRNVLRDAQVEPEVVDYINAHGTSTPYNDKFETLAIKRVFGDHSYKLAVSSTKSMTGHALGAAGGIEACYTALAVERQILPPTINYETPDPECDLDYVPNRPRPAKITYAMSNSSGFGGTNAGLLLKRVE
ncbi:MAG: beta-ketoacyl-ACP synthase II [Acidobacteria bacterium]|nr:beta-ketoacyl-ACP synthase II [Acidobacteriota bacterium]